MKVDVVIPRRVERRINANHARPRPEILPLLIVLKHHERDVTAKGEIDAVIRRFGGIHPTDRPRGSYERVDIVIWDAGNLDDEARSAPSFILGKHLCLSESDLMREDRNGGEAQATPARAKTPSPPPRTGANGAAPDQPAMHAGLSLFALDVPTQLSNQPPNGTLPFGGGPAALELVAQRVKQQLRLACF